MAENLDDGEFWLPPQFLTDDDILRDYRNNSRRSTGDKCFAGENGSGVYSPFEFPFGFGPNSDLSSPVESVVGSTETESDEEDYIAELTRKLTRSTLHDDLRKADAGFGYENTKSWVIAGSPQSTLCNVMGGCGCNQGSSRGSPTCPSQVTSPPAAAGMNQNDASWNLLYAAAGEVARMRMAEEGAGYYQNRGLLVPPRKPNSISTPLKSTNSNLGFLSNQPLSYHQLQAAQFQQLKQQQMLKQQSSPNWGQSKAIGHYPQNQTQQMVQNRGRNSSGRPLGLSPSAWPSIQQSQQQHQQPGSGMRAVFLGNPGCKRQSTGTGVFLPRRIGTPTESRKKPGCSRVLLPDRVVQALNLNLESVESMPQLQSRCNGSFSHSDYDAAFKYRNNILMAQQRRNLRPQPVMNNEARLPPEWTY